MGSSILATIGKYFRAALILYVILTTVTLIVGSFSTAAILSFPFGGFRLARKNAQRFPGIFLNALNAIITYFLVESYFIVYVDEVDLLRDRENPKSTLSLISKRFGFEGKIEEVKEDESRDIVISNHQIYADWIYIWAFLALLGRAGNVKIVCKRVIQFVPIIGWVL